jgi:hypothetical protein
LLKIVINEVDRAKELLENIDTIKENSYQNLLIIAKYYKYVLNYQENKIKRIKFITRKTVKNIFQKNMKIS